MSNKTLRPRKEFKFGKLSPEKRKEIFDRLSNGSTLKEMRNDLAREGFSISTSSLLCFYQRTSKTLISNNAKPKELSSDNQFEVLSRQLQEIIMELRNQNHLLSRIFRTPKVSRHLIAKEARSFFEVLQLTKTKGLK